MTRIAYEAIGRMCPAQRLAQARFRYDTPCRGPQTLERRFETFKRGTGRQSEFIDTPFQWLSRSFIAHAEAGQRDTKARSLAALAPDCNRSAHALRQIARD